LSFHDFALGISGDCFSFVKEIEHLSSMDDVLKRIDESFGLGISSDKNVGMYKTIVNEYKQPEVELGKRYCIIQCLTRKFTKEELQYWGEYHLNLEDLRKNHVYALSKVYINRQLFPIKETELKFGYLFGGNSTLLSWKLYFPTKKKKGKWISSVPIDTAYGLENLDKEHNGLILDSLKDKMVCAKVFEHCAGIQNETRRALSNESIEYINGNTKQTFLGFDSDAPGKSASRIITDELGWRHINTPDRLLPDTKDFAAWGKLEGLDSLYNHFLSKGLIT
jgi:hypothetical protein